MSHKKPVHRRTTPPTYIAEILDAWATLDFDQDISAYACVRCQKPSHVALFDQDESDYLGVFTYEAFCRDCVPPKMVLELP